MSALSHWSEPNPTECDNKTVVDRTRIRTEHYPDVVPFIERSLSGSKRSITNREFLQKTEKIAKYLVYMGVKKSDKVAIYGKNSLEWIIGEFAVFFAGAASVHINILNRDASDALEVMDVCKCKFLLIDPTDDNGAARLISSLKERDDNYQVLLLRKNENYQLHDIESEVCGPERTTELPQVDPDDDAIMYSTSGSTGRPKLVLYNHFTMVCGTPSDDKNPTFAHFGGPSKFTIFNDRTFSWMGGSTIISFLHGNQLIFTSTSPSPTKDEAMQIWKIVTEEKCMGGCFLPYLMQNVIDALKEVEDDGFRLEMIFSGGQIMDETLVKSTWRCCKVFYMSYGFTECFSTVCLTPVSEGQSYYTGYAGKINKGMELKIVDDSDDLVQLGTQGNIQVRHRALFKGYFANEELTKEVFTESGWFRTGDTGILKDEGILTITGRKKDVISRGTRKIIPGSIEEKIQIMPGVKSVVVIGVPDDLLLEEVCVCFTAEEGMNVPPADVEKFCNDIFLKEEAVDGMGEMPKYFLRFEVFPLLYNGKLDKVQLKKLAVQNLNLGNE